MDGGRHWVRDQGRHAGHHHPRPGNSDARKRSGGGHPSAAASSCSTTMRRCGRSPPTRWPPKRPCSRPAARPGSRGEHAAIARRATMSPLPNPPAGALLTYYLRERAARRKGRPDGRRLRRQTGAAARRGRRGRPPSDALGPPGDRSRPAGRRTWRTRRFRRSPRAARQAGDSTP